ncbi:hypothetical protein ES707_07409 [subsurface metagenome]
MQDWQIALIGLLGVIIGILATAFWNWRERKERFKVMTFEKRLEAHQLAFYWNQTIYHSLSSRDAEQISKCIREAQEWWNGNCLLLDEKSQKSFLSVFNSGNRYSRNIRRPGSEPEAERIWDDLNNNLADIIQGIGAEHLQRVEDENIQGESKNKDEYNKGIKNKILMKLGVNIWLIPFIVVLLGGVGFIIYTVYKIPLNPLPTPFTETTRLSYIFYSVASVFALIAALWVTANGRIKGIIILAIYLFFAGMIINLVSFIT